jgi:hypothetical protein
MTQIARALIEQFLDPTHVARAKFVTGQGDSQEIKLITGSGQCGARVLQVRFDVGLRTLSAAGAIRFLRGFVAIGVFDAED